MGKKETVMTRRVKKRVGPTSCAERRMISKWERFPRHSSYLSNQQTLAWYENTNGLGNFGTRQVIATGVGVENQTISAADVDGDGDLDAVAIHAWYENTVGVGGSWTPHTISNFNFGVPSAADIDEALRGFLLPEDDEAVETDG